MPNVIDTGFGGNLDNVLGEQPPLAIKQTNFGDFRARSIYAGANGAMIESVHVTPRTGLTATASAFPAAGLYSLIGFISESALDINANFQFAQKDFTAAKRVFLNSSRSTLLTTDIVPFRGFYIPPNTYAHVICLTPRDAAGVGIATVFDLTVIGHDLTGGELPYKLR